MLKIKEVRRFRKRFLVLCVGLSGFAVGALSSARAGTAAVVPGDTPNGDKTQVNVVPALNQVAGTFYTFGADPAAGGKRVLFIGNSITLHGPKPSIGWTNHCGMAASDLQHDYLHRFAERMSAQEPKTSYALFQVAGSVERGFTNSVWLTEKTFAPVRNYRPDAIFLFFGANVPRTYDKDPSAYPHRFGDAVVDMVRFIDPDRKARIFISEGYYKRPVLDAEKESAAKTLGATMVRMSDIRANGATRGRFNHPNDYGMKCIADRFWDAYCDQDVAPRTKDEKEMPFLCRGEGLALWTNDMTSVKAARLTDEGLEVLTASWKDVGLAVNIPDALQLGPDDEFVFRAKATCPSTGRPAVVGTIAAQYEGETGFAGNRTEFCWNLDGQWHDYRVRAFDTAAGRILKRIKLGLPPEARASGVIVISEIAIRSNPVAPCFTVMNAAADGFARTDAPVGLRVRVWNRGTVEAKNVTLTPDALPAGVEWVTRPMALGIVPRDGCGNFRAAVRCAKPMAFVQRFTLAADGVSPTAVEVPVRVEVAPAVRKADYVPEPRPPKCAYDIAACYFPGWMERKRWSKIERMCPERKPLLGWYDETNPEVVDWQIKWYAEHGIGILMMDWYWNNANIRLDHWLTAFAQAKWRKYLRWSVMWCNESQKPNHSVEDNRKLVRHWIDNYFAMPEYYRIDDKPVVGIFVPEHLMRDLGVQGTKDFLSEARTTARTAGYKGIHFIGYFRPTDDAGGTVPVQFRGLGFDEVAIYNYYGHFGAAEAPRRYAWKHVEATSRADWERRTKSSNVPFWPMLGTGRDERPWVNRTEVYGRTVASFARMCREMRKFADEKGIRRIQLGPVNEWGEGSYIEPCVEFGFGMFDAVRDAFCEKPAEGWPENVVPSDLGLGPYDLPADEPAPVVGEAMDLTDAKLHGWYPLGSHVKSLEPTKEGLHVTAATGTPAILCDYEPFEAAKFSRLVVRMRSTLARGTFRLYWRSEEKQWCEAASATCPIVKEDGWRDYVFDLSSCPAWCQRIFEIRLQPSGKPPFDYVISSVRFE